MNWKRPYIIQVSDQFIPYSDFVNSAQIPDILSFNTITRKPQPALIEWEYDLAQVKEPIPQLDDETEIQWKYRRLKEEYGIITILNRNQFSCPSCFWVNKNGVDKYFIDLYKDMIKLNPDIPFFNFCINPDEYFTSEKVNPITTFYFYKKTLYREDKFLHSIIPNTTLYIGEIFEYTILK